MSAWVALSRLWNQNLAEAPPNTFLLVEIQGLKNVWAEYDSTWSKGKGAWFNAKGHLVPGVLCWHPRGKEYEEALLSSYEREVREFLASHKSRE